MINIGNEDRTQSTLLDRVTINCSYYKDDKYYYDTKDSLKSFLSYYFIDQKTFEINPVFEPFKNISNVWIEMDTLRNRCQLLKLIKSGKLNISTFGIQGENSRELETLTSPEYYNAGIRNLTYEFKAIHKITEKAVQNLNGLNIKEMWFYDCTFNKL